MTISRVQILIREGSPKKKETVYGVK